MIDYPEICIQPGAVLQIGDYPVELIGTPGADALVAQFGSLPNGSQMRFVHDLISSADAALVFTAWRNSLAGTRPLALPAVIAGGITNAAAVARWLTPKGQQWHFSGSPEQAISRTHLLRVEVSLIARSQPCGLFF